MKLIVGLGNPGKKYEKTRHNMGFMVVDKLADISRIDVDKEIFEGLLGRGVIFDEDVMLFKPTTFMNLSGNAVRKIVDYFKIDIDDVVIVYDDMALEPGRIRLRLNGSSGGQKGMESVIQCLGTEEIKRIRVGIGEPEDNAIDYVLTRPTKDEQLLIDVAIDNAVEALKETIKNSFERAMNKYN